MKHVKIKHEGVMYTCSKCEHAATTARALKVNVEIHEGVRYTCPKCEFVVTAASNLKIHVERKHEGLRYPCSQCEHIYYST